MRSRRRGETQSGDPRYRLQLGRFKLLERALAKTAAQDEEFRSSVIGRLEEQYGRLDRESEEAVGEAFATFVGRMLSNLGERCASRLVHERSGRKLSYPSIDDDLKEAVRGLPSQIQDAARLAFKEALRDPSPEERDYLYTAGQVYYIAELLHVDPALQVLQRERFEDTTVFLDTNLLISLLLESHRDHDAVTNMARLCRSAGFTLVYGQRTAEELDDLITGAEAEFRAAPPFDLDAAANLAAIVENPFLQGWLGSYSSHKSSWRQYRVRIAAWRGLFEGDEINLHQLPQANHGDEYYRRLDKSLRAVRKSRQGEKLSARRPRAVEHDAELLTSLRSLVETDDSAPHPFGARYWFVTLDRRLVDCVRAQASNGDSNVCMLAEEWIQYVSPFLSPDVSRLDSATAFAGLLSSRFIPQLGRGLTLQQLRIFTQPSVAKLTEGLSEQEACRAVATAHREAVRRDGTRADDEKAIKRLAALAERQRDHHRRKQRDEASDELAQMRSARDEEAREATAASQEYAERIEALEAELSETQEDQRSSIAFWGRRLRGTLTRAWQRLTAWRRRHPRGAIAITIALLAIVVAEIAGLGGTIGRVLGLLALVIPVIATDAGQLRSNLMRAFGG